MGLGGKNSPPIWRGGRGADGVVMRDVDDVKILTTPSGKPATPPNWMGISGVLRTNTYFYENM